MKPSHLLLACLLPLSAAPAPVVENKVKDRFSPAPYEAQKIEGLLGDRMRANLQLRLLRIEEGPLLAGFRQRPGNHPWIGEHIGKYLHAAVNTYRYSRDERLKTQMDRMAVELMKTQLPDGYLGTYTDDQRWTSWDVWSHKYNLIGLLAWYELTGDARALETCRRIGDLLHRTFVTQKRDIIASSTHVGMAATSVLEPVVTLYRYTGDPRHLALAEHIVRGWEQPNGPKLMSSLLSASPNVHRTGNAKAYEMMSDLVGLVELYRVTAKPDYLKAALNAQQDIALRRRYITGATSTHEHFQDDRVLPGEIANDVGEGCATVTWLQLNWQLLRVTGEARFAHELERTVFNQLLAAQDPLTGDICYFTPMNGRKRPRTDINCCRSSEPRGISMIPQLAWGTFAEGLAVLLYAPGQVEAGGWKARSETAFPQTGDVTLTVSGPARGTLFLRVPEWASRFTVDGKPAQPSNGYAALTRDWTRPQSLRIAMSLDVRWIDGGRNYPGFTAVMRGPQVLALDRASNLDVPYLHRTSVGASPRLAGDAVDGLALTLDGRVRKTTLRLVPFSEARDYRIWLRKDPPPAALPVSLAFGARESLSSRDENVHASLTDEDRRAERRTKPPANRPDDGIDLFAVDLDRPVAFRRVVFHHGTVTPQGGAFAAPPEVQVQLVRNGPWETIGRLDYPADPKSADAATLELPGPREASGVRIRGPRRGAFTTCTELELFP